MLKKIGFYIIFSNLFFAMCTTLPSFGADLGLRFFSSNDVKVSQKNVEEDPTKSVAKNKEKASKKTKDPPEGEVETEAKAKGKTKETDEEAKAPGDTKTTTKTESEAKTATKAEAPPKDEVKKTDEEITKKEAQEKDPTVLGAQFGVGADVSPDIKVILDRGAMRVGMVIIDQPPFHLRQGEGKFTGFDIDFGENLAKELNVKMEIVEGKDWEDLIEKLLAGEIDVILSNLSLTSERATKISCSKPYAKIRQCLLLNRVLVAREAAEKRLTLRQIFNGPGNCKLMIQTGTGYISSTVSLFPKADVSSTESWEEIIDNILKRKIFGTMSDEVEVKIRMRTVQAMELMPVILKGKYDYMVVGVDRRSTQLLHFINSYIDSYNIECNVEEF